MAEMAMVLFNTKLQNVLSTPPFTGLRLFQAVQILFNVCSPDHRLRYKHSFLLARYACPYFVMA